MTVTVPGVAGVGPAVGEGTHFETWRSYRRTSTFPAGTNAPRQPVIHPVAVGRSAGSGAGPRLPGSQHSGLIAGLRSREPSAFARGAGIWPIDDNDGGVTSGLYHVRLRLPARCGKPLELVSAHRRCTHGRQD